MRQKLDLVRDLAFIALTLAGREPHRPTMSAEDLRRAEAEVGIIDLDPPNHALPKRREIFQPPILQRLEEAYILPYSFSASSASSPHLLPDHYPPIKLRKTIYLP